VSLRARLTVGTACALAVAIVVGLFTAYVVVRAQLRGEIDRSLKAFATPLTRTGSQPARRPDLPDPLRLPRNRAPNTLGGAAGYFQSVSATGKTSLPPGEKAHLPVGLAQAVAAGKHASYFSDANVNRVHLRIYTTRTSKDTALQIARPLTEVDRALGRIRLLFLVISLVAVAGAATLGLLVSRATLRPVKRLTEDAERIATTRDLSDRADQNRTDELGRLAVAFNTMLDALTGSISAQRQLVADASHELRTPLATVRTNLEVLELHDDLPIDERRRVLAEATEEVREMTHLMDELVELARGDAQVLTLEPTRLDLVAREAVAAAARRSAVPIQLETTPTVVDAAPTALIGAISNLLDNAAKWSPPDGAVEVTVANGTLSVRDHGRGIDPTDLPYVFDRFYRADAARTMPGSGLGLAIVRQVAEAHAGTITAEAAPGGGSLFTLRLPIHPSGDS
jgi:two-component system, OmpR family, sensor histidine kinase MprB